MKKYLLLTMCIIILGLVSGCNGHTSSPALENEGFVKPKNYVTIVNVETDPSFDVYLDEQAIVLAIEPKNENAKNIDTSGAIGRDLANSMRELMSAVCKNNPVGIDSAVLIKVLDGEEIIATMDVVETVKDAWADTVAKETVNNSMESVIRARLVEEHGCRCKECRSSMNWYATAWYSYGEWDRKRDYDEYESTMEHLGRLLERQDENDPLQKLAIEIYENMTYERFNTKECQKQLFDLACENPMKYRFLSRKIAIGDLFVTHEEIEITFKIVDSEINGNGLPVESVEYSAEEYFEKYPEERDVIEGLEKAFRLDVRVYENGQWDGKSYFTCRVYLVDGKWYVNEGLCATPGG